VPYARVAVVLAAHPTVPEDALSRQEVLDLYRGRRTRWRDGSAAVVLLREEADSSHEAVALALPGFREALAAARRSQRGPVLLSDAALQEALLGTPGSVGLLDRGAIVAQSLPLRTVAIPGAPVKDLAFVCAGEPAGPALAFLRFVASLAGQEVIRTSGYLPPAGGRP
jgi:phosphate transport system substrate-binding protein